MTALFLALVSAVSLCACAAAPVAVTPTPEPEATAAPAPEKRFALSFDPNDSLSPYLGESKVNLTLNSLLYEGLFRLDEHFVPQPVLAQSAKADASGLEWTVELADDRYFCDGTPVSAELVAAALRAAKQGGRYALRLQKVRAVQAKEGAVVISLTAPNGNLPALLDLPIVLEQEGAFLGTGRYGYAGEGDSFRLQANAYYPGDVGYERVELCPVTTADQRIAAFNSGMVTAVSADLTSSYELGYSCSYEVWDYLSCGMIFVGFKCNDGICASPTVRRALAMAFDRTALTQELLAGHGDAAALPVHPESGEYIAAAARRLDYDPAEALELLAQEGYTVREDGLLHQGRTPAKVTLLVNGDNAAKLAIADRLSEELAALGITVNLSHPSWAGYQSALKAGNFDLYLGEIALTPDFDCSEVITGSLNYGKYYSEEWNWLYQNWRQASGAARTAAGADLWSRFASEVPLAPLCFRRESLLVRWGELSGLSPTPTDPFGGFGA